MSFRGRGANAIEYTIEYTTVSSTLQRRLVPTNIYFYI